MWDTQGIRRVRRCIPEGARTLEQFWGAASWLTTIAATGITLDAVGLLAALGYALAMPWWRTYRIPNTPAAPADARV
jgi:hypothetical protein